MNTCEKCSEQVAEEKAFCPNCGHSMTPERQRTPEFSEEMGETMLGYNPPVKTPPARKPTPPPPVTPAKAKPPKASPAPAASHRAASVMSYDLPQEMQQGASDDESHRKLRLILRASAVLFALSILFVAILYFMGKI